MSEGLGTYIATRKREIFEDLSSGKEPRIGRFDVSVLGQVRDLGTPQMGTTVFSPGLIKQEFIYRDGGMNVVFTVEMDPPERIVFMPVPVWVLQTIWQGEVDGSYRFESEAAALLENFSNELEAEPNALWFEKRLPTTRE